MGEGSSEGIPHTEKINSQSVDWPWCTRYPFVVVVDMFLCIFQVALWLPGIVRNGITFPFDQILQLSSVDSAIFDLFNFILYSSDEGEVP